MLSKTFCKTSQFLYISLSSDGRRTATNSKYLIFRVGGAHWGDHGDVLLVWQPIHVPCHMVYGKQELAIL